MMTVIQTYVRQGRRYLRQWALEPRLHVLGQTALCALMGLVLSAASLGNIPIPLALGAVCSGFGWPAVMTALGAGIGYLVFWGEAGLQGLFWLLPGTAAALLLGGRRLTGEVRLLMPSVATLIVSAVGVGFQLWMADTTPVPLYLLRVLLAGGSTWLCRLVREGESPGAKWAAGAAAVLALVQLAPSPWLNPGYLAAGFLWAGGGFPAAALAGMALDLAGTAAVPMTAVACMTGLLGLIPRRPVWLTPAAAGVSYLITAGLCGQWELAPLPMLVLGAAAGTLTPRSQSNLRRRGETGAVQVRLELTAAVLSQTERLLLEIPEVPPDEPGLMARAAQRACGSCPCRKGCRDEERLAQWSPELLHHALIGPGDLPFACRKSGRVLQELRRSQEQLRTLRAGRDRLRECRWAVIQQYRFLSEYLQDISDTLGRREVTPAPVFRPRVGALSRGKEEADGDRCVWFPGVGCRYYVLLCDGMGTGLGAAQESRDAVGILRRLLEAGFPAEYALRSLNALCALRDKPGAVTADLLELELDTGKGRLYKWGAAPSWLLRRGGAEKIGTAGPPPGLSVTDGRETVERLSLRRGETLVLVSDGVDAEELRRHAGTWERLPPGELAEQILRQNRDGGMDDATAAVIRLVWGNEGVEPGTS